MWAEAQIKRGGELYMHTYTKDDYKTPSNQVLCAVKDNRGIMFFANEAGVLMFDGSNWNLIKTATNAVRALAIDTASNTVYVGSRGDIGLLETNDAGAYVYRSLADMIPEENSSISFVQNIMIDPDEGVVFVAQTGIYILKDTTMTVIPAIDNRGFCFAYNVDGKLYVIDSEEGINEIKDGKLTKIDYLFHAGTTSIRLVDKSKGRIVILNKERGIYYYEGDSLYQPNVSLPKNIIADVSCFAKTHDGKYYLLGTSWHGLVVTDLDFNVIRTDDINGQIYSIFEDDNHLVWITTSNNGIVLLDVFSPFTWYSNDETGIVGSVRSILQTRDELYIGADAVFHIKKDSIHKQFFKEVKNTNERYAIWKLDTVQGSVIGGAQKGLLYIDTNNVLTNIDKEKTRNIRNFIVPREKPDILIGGSNAGFAIYEKKNGKWAYKTGAKGFNEYVRHIQQDADGWFVISDNNKGIFRVKFNETFDSIVASKKYDADEGGLPSNFGNYIFNTGNGLIAGTVDGLYKYDRDSDKYVQDEEHNTALGGKNVYDMMYNDNIGNLWVKHVVTDKHDENINYWFLERITPMGDTSAKITRNIFRPYMSRINSFGYIGEGCYIIGDKEGFVHYDDRIEKNVEAPYNALIRKIELIHNDSLIYGGNETNKKIVLPFSERSIRIKFAATTYEYPEAIKFKSYLENNDVNWSDFRSENYKEYPSLSPGKYTLHVIAINAYNVESKEATITFEILAPWYLTKLAILLYIALFALAIWLFVKAYTKKLIRDKEKLEKIVEERTAEIRQQSQLIMEKNEEITAKNKEITDSIRYAQRIQTAMLPMEEKIQSALPEHFILFRPKDIVSGDYYWFAETEKSIIITAADCTGHGVPGAFMSMIGSQILTEIVVEGITSPEEILTNQNRRIRKALKQDTTANQDGMDMALCTIDKKTHLVEYSGAKNQLVVIQNDELTEYKADKQSIGGQQLYGADFQYKKVAIQPDGNTWFYMFSDGYKDQFGGENNTKFLIKNLRALFMQIHNEPPAKQREILNDTIEKWIKDGNTEQTDDIIIIGFKC